MARKQWSAKYSANWRFTRTADVPNPNLYELTLEVRQKAPVGIVVRFNTERERTHEIVKYLDELVPQLRAIRVDLDAHVGILNRDEFGKSYLHFKVWSNVKIKSDDEAAKFLNEVAKLFGYPPVSMFSVSRDYVVFVDTEGKGERRWVDEGWWLAERMRRQIAA